MLKALKRNLLTVCRRTGLMEVIARSRWRQRRLLILCYHSVSLDEEHKWRPLLYFSPDEFEARLKLIREWRLNVLPLAEAVARLQADTLPPRSAVLSFDDGTADFGLIVWPMLKRFGFPGTVYTATYYSDKGCAVFPLMCSYLLWKARAQVLPPVPDLGLPTSSILMDAKVRSTVERQIVDHAESLHLSAEERELMLVRLADVLALDYATLRERRVLQMMTPAEMRALTEDGADIQLHTHRHRTPRDESLFAREIIENRASLERATGRAPEHFCYPSGVHYPEYAAWLTSLGVKTATISSPGGLATRGVSPLFIPRVVDTISQAPIEMEGWLSGISALLPRRSRA
jgi:peptidoglycan/xylan/chitin deacetylase (PgdA/CDA1 family)